MSRLVRLLTYNIHGDRAHADVARVVRALAPDIVVVNETPKLPLLWRRRCDRVARAWGMRRAGGGRDAGSSMICVSERVTVEAVSVRRLRQPRFAPRRGLVSMQALLVDRPVGVVGVHLSLLPDSRPDEMREALADVRALHGTLVVAGDVNERPGGPSWRLLADVGFVDHSPADGHQTFPSRAPDRRIDAMLLNDARAEVVSHGVVAELPGYDTDEAMRLLAAASDHRPVVMDLRLP